jgi:hypothetical protein
MSRQHRLEKAAQRQRNTAQVSEGRLMQRKYAKAAQVSLIATQVGESSTSRRLHKLAQGAQRQLKAAQVGGGRLMQNKSAKAAQVSSMQHKSARVQCSTGQ